jgi:cytochrome bd ubiquinol oxidase subunit II
MNLWVDACWFALGIGVVLYALSGGPDLGAGVWNLLASGPRKAEQRRALHDAIAPIWEANHVWLIFVIVLMFSAFSRAFSAISIALHIPIALATLGIVMRGAAFAFHAYGIHSARTRRRWSWVFSLSSVFTPILLGDVAGALGTGQIRVQAGQVTSGFFAGWTTPFAWLVGCFTLALFATLAAVYLAAEAEDPALADDFRARALGAEVVAGIFAGLVLWRASVEAPALYDVLMGSGWSWAVQAVTADLALVTILLLWVRQPRIARYTCAAQAAAVVMAWGVAMDRHFILPDVSVISAVTYLPALPSFALVYACGAAVLFPAFLYLLKVFKTRPDSERGDDA